jgi:hypothetical protein
LNDNSTDQTLAPAEVPAELVDMAHKAMRFSDELDTESALVDALAAVLPEHEKQVREQVAMEIEAEAPKYGSGGLPSFVGTVMRQAAHVARGGAK